MSKLPWRPGLASFSPWHGQVVLARKGPGRLGIDVATSVPCKLGDIIPGVLSRCFTSKIYISISLVCFEWQITNPKCDREISEYLPEVWMLGPEFVYFFFILILKQLQGAATLSCSTSLAKVVLKREANFCVKLSIFSDLTWSTSVASGVPNSSRLFSSFQQLRWHSVQIHYLLSMLGNCQPSCAVPW